MAAPPVVADVGLQSSLPKLPRSGSLLWRKLRRLAPSICKRRMPCSEDSGDARRLKVLVNDIAERGGEGFALKRSVSTSRKKSRS